jgi:CHAT domain-containing protein/predicted negative regulator of RcsB-dependent stress response
MFTPLSTRLKLRTCTRLFLPAIYIFFSGNILLGSANVLTSIPSTQNIDQEAEQKKLVLNRSIIQKIGKQESHNYQIAVAFNQFVHFTLEQKKMDLWAAIYDPSGQRIKEVLSRQQGKTPLSFISKTKGTYRISIRPVENQPNGGQYEVKVADLRSARAADKNQILAEDSYAEGVLLRWKNNASLSRRAIEKFQRAISYWRVTGNKEKEAHTLNIIGDIVTMLGDNREALTYYAQSITISKQINSTTVEIEALNGCAKVSLILGDKKRARGFLDNSFLLIKTSDYKRGEAQSLKILGDIHYESGEPTKAKELYNQSLTIYQRLGDMRGEATCLLYLGIVSVATNNIKDASIYYENSLSLWTLIDDKRGKALVFATLGSLRSKLGQKQEALNLLDEALQIITDVGDLDWKAIIYNMLAYVYTDLGDKKTAIEYHEKALLLFQKLEITEAVASTLRVIGSFYLEMGEANKAFSYFNQSLKLVRAYDLKAIEPRLLQNIGDAFTFLGQIDKALHAYNQALELNQRIEMLRYKAYIFNSLGNLYSKNGEKQKALEHFRETLQIHKNIKDKFSEVTSLYHIACIERDLARFKEAQEHIEEAIKLAESLRENVKGPEFRTSYFATVQKSFDLYIDLLMQQHKQNVSTGFDIQALELSERARARTFLESLLESRMDIRKGVDPELLQREKELRQKIDEKANYRDQMLSKSHTENQVSAVNTEINELSADYEQVRSRIRAANPNYSSITFTQPIKLKEIQELLDSETVLLEYRLGEERSYLWLVSRNSVMSYELPDRKEIESEAKKVYDWFTTPNNSAPIIAKRKNQSSRADASDPQSVERLSDILFGQIASSIKSKRLLIVADGVLQYISFAALTSPNSSQLKVPLIVEHEIINLPSASVLAALRKEFGNRALAPKSIAVIADPVFTKEDVHFNIKNRSLVTIASNHSFNRDLVRAFSETGGKNKRRAILRLPFAREEADNILKLVTDSSALKAVEFDASLANVKRLDLQRYRFIHFATHGLANSENPYLSGIVLSLFDDKGKPQDGFLRLQDISDLKLSSELVVLSACQTALGKEFRGEGLISLTRGFMQAGSKRVLASLWNVNDAVTADLMKRFYQGVLVDGLPPAAALRAAQIAMWKQKNKNTPYYWAAFVLEGEWK